MGSEGLFHRRKAKTAHDLARKKSNRSRYDRVLIICEDSKTEPNYLREIVDFLKLNSANIEVDGSCGSSPISVVKYSKKRYLEEKKKENPFDRVFCVFDKDSHSSYERALNEILNAKPKKVFQAINSVPCFEYWLLLHFKFSTKPFTAIGRKSACDHLIQELKKEFPDYSKGDSGIYQKLMDKTHQAIKNSKRSLFFAQKSGTDNPTTKLHELVEYLHQLKNG